MLKNCLHIKYIVLWVALVGLASDSISIASAKDTPPPMENIALGKPYALEPTPNYLRCSDPGDFTQLTDGKAGGKLWIWALQETVGWEAVGYAIITVDLGTIQPIQGVAGKHCHFGEQRWKTVPFGWRFDFSEHQDRSSSDRRLFRVLVQDHGTENARTLCCLCGLSAWERKPRLL